MIKITSLKQTIFAILGIAVVFVLVASITMTYFSRSWRYCQDVRWVGADAEATTNCTRRYGDGFNTSYVDAENDTYSTYLHTEDGQTWPVDPTAKNASAYCLNCQTAGGYRVTNQGLMVLIFALFAIAVGYPYIRTRI